MAFRLEDLLPAFNFRIDDTNELSLFVNDVLQPALDQLCSEAVRWIDQQDVDTAGSESVNALLRDLGNPFSSAFSLPLNRRRLLARVLVDIYKRKGTAGGMEDVILVLTGIIATVVSPATIDAWILGEDVIADTPADPPVLDESLTDFAFLGSDPEFERYTFQIEVPQVLTDEERAIITEIVTLMKPAHTHFLGFIEPTVGLVIEHWELGISFVHELGEPLLGDEIDLHE